MPYRFARIHNHEERRDNANVLVEHGFRKQIIVVATGAHRNVGIRACSCTHKKEVHYGTNMPDLPHSISTVAEQGQLLHHGSNQLEIRSDK